jgi:hypothetical protein
MKFSRTSTDGTRIEMEVRDESTIDEVLDEFKNFLRACGYLIKYNKVIAVVNADELVNADE